MPSQQLVRQARALDNVQSKIFVDLIPECFLLLCLVTLCPWTPAIFDIHSSPQQLLAFPLTPLAHVGGGDVAAARVEFRVVTVVFCWVFELRYNFSMPFRAREVRLNQELIQNESSPEVTAVDP